MQQEQLIIFIESIQDYFKKITGTPVIIGVPYLKEIDRVDLLKYTGAIGISGRIRGAIYFTAEEEFIYKLLCRIMPGSERTTRNLASMTGELANTIAGNAQKTLGSEFHISVPMVITNGNDTNKSSLAIEAPTFIIPLKWENQHASLGVGLEHEE